MGAFAGHGFGMRMVLIMNEPLTAYMSVSG